MSLAADSITILHGGNAVQLRPSLLAAYRLNARYGVTKLFNGVAEGRLGVILDILAEGGASPNFGLAPRTSLRDTLDNLKAPIFKFLAICFGADDSTNTSTSTKPAKPLDIEAGLAALFEVGTGWLGWTPADTWAATPAEILTAQRGLVAKLKAIHGSAESAADDVHSSPTTYTAERLAEIDKLGYDPAFDREGFAKLKAKIAGRA